MWDIGLKVWWCDAPFGIQILHQGKLKAENVSKYHDHPPFQEILQITHQISYKVPKSSCGCHMLHPLCQEMWRLLPLTIGLHLVKQTFLNHPKNGHPHLGPRSWHAHQVVSRPSWGHFVSTSTSSRVFRSWIEKLNVLVPWDAPRCVLVA